MPIHKKERFADARDQARKLFLEDPNASIDSIARTLNAHYSNHGLVKDELSRIRMEVRKLIDHSHSKSTSVVQLRKERAMQHSATIQPHTEPAPVLTKKDAEGKRARITFLSDWVLSHPNARISDAQEALHDTFGIGLNTKYVADTLKAARQLVGLDKPQEKVEGATPATFNLAHTVKTLRDAGIRSIEIMDDGRYRVEYKE